MAHLTPVVDQAMQHASAATGVPYEIISAVTKYESGYNPNSVSPVGAMGLMQLMPDTARGLGVTNAFDPVQNTLAGAKFLLALYRKFGNWHQAFAAYNWGPARVAHKPDPSQWPEGVQRYVAGVFALANLGPVPFGSTIEVETRRVSPAAMQTLRRWGLSG